MYGGHVGHLYKEQEIEKRAWDVYGGPSGLDVRKKQ